MDRRLSRSNAVCKRNWRVRGIVPRALQCPRTASQRVVLSGFSTAVETFLGRLLLGPNPSSLPPDRKARQLPLPRDDIPQPHPVVLVLEVCRLRLARICFPLALRLHSGVQYGKA